MKLTSRAFPQAGEIPKKFTCEGDNVSPALEWTGAPRGTKSFALICEDPDAPMKTFTHWTIYDLPSASTGLPEGLTDEPEPPGGGRQGKNSFGRVGYGGPCPPNGPFHRYYFTLYALERRLALPAGASIKEVRAAIEGHQLATARLMGRYRKVKLRTFVRALLGRRRSHESGRIPQA